MRSLVVLGTAAGAAALLAAGPLGAQLVQPKSVSLVRDNGRWAPALFICDATNADRAFALTAPDRQRRATLLAFARPGLAPIARTTVTVGQGDAGMSQLWFPLADAAGRQVGAIHTVSPGVVEPGATTPTVVGVRTGTQDTNCRFAPQTRVLGVTAKRSVQVVATERNGYRYRSYNDDTTLPEIDQPWGGRDTRASLTIDNGRLIDQRGSRRVFQFDRAGYVYRVLVSLDPAHAGGGVQVLRDGRVLLAEPFGGYTASAQP